MFDRQGMEWKQVSVKCSHQFFPHCRSTNHRYKQYNLSSPTSQSFPLSVLLQMKYFMQNYYCTYVLEVHRQFFTTATKILENVLCSKAQTFQRSKTTFMTVGHGGLLLIEVTELPKVLKRVHQVTEGFVFHLSNMHSPNEDWPLPLRESCNHVRANLPSILVNWCAILHLLWSQCTFWRWTLYPMLIPIIVHCDPST